MGLIIHQIGILQHRRYRGREAPTMLWDQKSHSYRQSLRNRQASIVPQRLIWFSK